LGPRGLARALFVAALVAVCVWMLWGFIPALTWALVIAIATWPLRERCVRLGLPPAAAAALLTVSLGILVILPFVLFGAGIAREAASIADTIDQARRGQLDVPSWLPGLPFVGTYAADWWREHFANPDTSKHLLDQSQSANALLWGRELGRWIVRRLVTLGFTLLTLFFLYRNGPAIAVEAERLAVRLFGSPARRFGKYSFNAIRATVNGLVFVGLAEGVILGIAYAVCGVPHPITLGVATGIFGIVPFGAPVVLVIASLTLVVLSRTVTALVLLGIGLCAIFVADHAVRPALIGGSIQLPFLWALLGVFGGLEAFGLVGLFVGPAIIAVALTIWREAAEKRLSPQ
jgi:predicted PurR-regulated permease PerM